MGDEELGFVVDAFDSNWIAPIGPKSSGTAAIHLALVSGCSAIGYGVCSSLTFVGSANPICYQAPSQYSSIQSR